MDIQLLNAKYLTKAGEYQEAAKFLSLILLENGQTKHAEDFKFKIYLQITGLYILAEDQDKAVYYFYRAKALRFKNTRLYLEIIYKVRNSDILSFLLNIKIWNKTEINKLKTFEYIMWCLEIAHVVEVFFKDLNYLTIHHILYSMHIQSIVRFEITVSAMMVIWFQITYFPYL